MTVDLKAIQLEEIEGGKISHIFVTGKLANEDYESFIPEIERLMESHGKIRLLVEFIDFEGWSVGALWEDLKFDWKHFNDFERIAIVGEKRWEKGMALFCKPFTTATLRYFHVAEREEALRWIEEDLPASNLIHLRKGVPNVEESAQFSGL